MLRIPHDHQPVYRVVRQGHRNALDTSFSQKAKDNRWNTAAFPVLYCCCSIRVARGVVRDLFRFAGVESSELRPAWQPKLVAIRWTGEVVDVISAEGIEAARLPEDYPLGVDKTRTRSLAAKWRQAGAEGIVSRSASLSRLGLRQFTGDHAEWGELSVYSDIAKNAPRLARTQPKGKWLLP